MSCTLLDVEERLAGREGAGGDGAGDLGGGLGILPEGEEGLADRDLDLGLVPRNNTSVAPDQANGCRAGDAIGAELGTAAEEEALGNIVGAVVDKRLLNEDIQLVEIEAERTLPEGERGEVASDFLGNASDELLVLLGEDGRLAAGKQERCERLADGVRNLAEIERLRPCGQSTCTSGNAGCRSRTASRHG
jgi:hypothetical protein